MKTDKDPEQSSYRPFFALYMAYTSIKTSSSHCADVRRLHQWYDWERDKCCIDRGQAEDVYQKFFVASIDFLVYHLSGSLTALSSI